MSKYLVTMTDGKMGMSTTGHSFRNDSSGHAQGHLNVMTKFVEFEYDIPLESEIKKLIGYHPAKEYEGFHFDEYTDYDILFMQKLEED